MANWQPDNNSLMQVIQLLKESQFPCNETQRAIQQVRFADLDQLVYLGYLCCVCKPQ
jgi:hypothetical protein